MAGQLTSVVFLAVNFIINKWIKITAVNISSFQAARHVLSYKILWWIQKHLEKHIICVHSLYCKVFWKQAYYLFLFYHLHSSSSLSISPKVAMVTCDSRIYCNWNPKYYIHQQMYIMYIFFIFIIHKCYI